MNIVLVAIESLFKHCRSLKEFWKKYDFFINEVTLASVNHCMREIKIEDINKVYKDYLDGYIPNYQVSHIKGKILLIEISSCEEIKQDYMDINAHIIFVTYQKIENIYEKFSLPNDKLKAIVYYEEIKPKLKVAEKIVRLKKKAKDKLEKEKFDEVSTIYKLLADLHYELNLVNLARDYYAYSAIAAERTEKWRRISYLWYSAHKPIKAEHNYKDYNSLEHTYPSISFERWSSFSEAEKRGRALQYAAYSDENHGGPSDSYWIFEEAAIEYLNAGNYGRAIECAVSATNRYTLCYHQVKKELIDLWNQLLSSPEKTNYLELLYISFSDIYRNLNLFQSEDADFFYIQAKKIQQAQLRKKKRFGKLLINKLWSIATRYGTDVSRFVLLTLVLVVILFPVSYFCCQYYNECAGIQFSVENLYRFYGCIKISLNIFFGIGSFSDVGGIFYLLVILETFYAYIALVIFSTSIIGKLLSQRI